MVESIQPNGKPLCQQFTNDAIIEQLYFMVDCGRDSRWSDIPEERHEAMTLDKARVVFATHMQAARTRKLHPYELKQLAIARQKLRQARKPAMNIPVSKGKKGNCRSNPAGVLIYGKVIRIEAQKTQPHLCDDDCKAYGHRYYHNFKTSPKMYGMADGSLLIK